MSAAKREEGGFFNYVSQLWFKYFPYWPVFLVLLIVCLGGAWLKLRYEVPQYQAIAKIMVKQGPEESQVLEELDQFTPKKPLENEMQILRSKNLMEEVVRNLHLYALTFTEGKFASKSAYSSAPIKIVAKDPDSIKYVNKVYYTVDRAKSQVIFNNTRYPINEWVKTPYGVLKFEHNSNTPAQDNKMYFSLVSPENASVFFINNLEVSILNKSGNILAARVVDEVPERAKSVVNELAEVYGKFSYKEKTALAANTLKFIEGRLGLVKRELDSIERKIQGYRSSQGAIDISSQGQQYLSNVNQNDQKISEINTQLDAITQVEQYILSKNNRGGIAPSTLGISDPSLNQLLTQLYQKELEYEKLKATTPENNPTMVSIADQIQKIKPSVLENVQNIKRNLSSNRNNLYSTNGMYSSMLRSIPQQERQLIDINREHGIKSEIYNFLLKKREETELSYGSSISDSKVINSAEVSGMGSPTKRVYFLAIIIAIGLGAALISGNEIFNRTILFRHEIENYTSWPVIAEISHDKSKEVLKVGNDSKSSFVAAQFRKLRTSLRFLGISSKRKKILVTSTIAGEGKSFIAANLGLSLSMTGKRVVMLEFDLSNPTLSDKLNVENKIGLTDYFKDNYEAEEVIVKTDVNENLFVIPSGPLPHNPSELIVSASDKIEDLLNYLDANFDYIILDTAPVGPMTDAYTLSSFCDATLYVIRHKHTPKVFVQRLDEENKINQLKNPAIVFNAVQSRGFNKNRYGYGYGYGYEYGYGYDNKEKKVSKV